MNSKVNKTKYYQVRVSAADLDAIRKQAEAERVSASAIIRRAVLAYLRNPASFFTPSVQTAEQPTDG